MLANAYSLDLRGVAVRRTGGHAGRIARSFVKQVLPKAGRYAVTCVGEAGPAQGEIEIGEDELVLESPADAVTSVIFEHAT
jgi:hypothetical protein